MATGMRPNLGLSLQNILAGDRPIQFPGVDIGSEAAFKANIPQGGGFFREGGMGRALAGALGDVLLQNAGMQPVYAPMQREKRQAQQEEVRWSRREQAEDDRWMRREQWQRANPEPTAMERNLRFWQSLPRDQQEAYREMTRNDPIVTTTLPNKQFYTGPQSGLIAALTGQVPQQSPGPKVGDVVADPRKAGGPSQPATGSFRR